MLGQSWPGCSVWRPSHGQRPMRARPLFRKAQKWAPDAAARAQQPTTRCICHPVGAKYLFQGFRAQWGDFRPPESHPTTARSTPPKAVTLSVCKGISRIKRAVLTWELAISSMLELYGCFKTCACVPPRISTFGLAWWQLVVLAIYAFSRPWGRTAATARPTRALGAHPGQGANI